MRGSVTVVNVLPSETGGYYAGNCVVAPGAIGPEELVALHRCPALRVGQVELRAVAIQRTQEPPGQEVVVGVPLVAAAVTLRALRLIVGAGRHHHKK